MKLNSGTAIAAFYATFMVALLYFVIKSTTYDNSLVMDNYYEQDLKYQEHYDKVVNNQALEQKVKIKIHPNDQSIDFLFPDNMKKVKGNIHFFCPSTKYGDVRKAIQVDEHGTMKVTTKTFKSGRWKIKLDWKNGEKNYYEEFEIVL